MLPHAYAFVTKLLRALNAALEVYKHKSDCSYLNDDYQAL